MGTVLPDCPDTLSSKLIVLGWKVNKCFGGPGKLVAVGVAGDRRTKKTRVSEKTRAEVLAWCRCCSWGHPLACDPNQRKCAPATIDDSLLARAIQAKDDAGWVARVVWGGVGWGFQR